MNAAKQLASLTLVAAIMGTSVAAAGSDGSPRVTALEDTIIPGYVPLARDAETLQLYERSYAWKESLLPRRIESLGSLLAQCRLEVLTATGEPGTIEMEAFRWTGSGPAAANRIASGRHGGLSFSVNTTTEYDGFIDTTLSIAGTAPTAIKAVDLVIRIASNADSTILGFNAESIRPQKDRQDLITAPYAGRFLNVVSFSDGDRSFWWVADSNKGWIDETRDAPTTSITRIDSETVELRQRIIAVAADSSIDTSLRFGLLATPVRPNDGQWRTERVISGNPTPLEAKLGTRFKIWWPTALAFDAFPYTDLTTATPNRLLSSDLSAYPGLEFNSRFIMDARRVFEVHALPYFSAHAISLLDPIAARQRSAWEIIPPRVFKDGLAPYSNRYDKPTFTHNAPGYTDHVIARFDELIDELGMEGVYLDHGPVMDSALPIHGGWTDAKGRSRPALDIFTTRIFLKGLRELFADKGRSGYIFIHTSGREIIPAYTFAHAMVSGEQFKQRVTDANYLKLLSPDEFRARFSPGQYGVPVYFLPSDWSNHRNEPAWRGSSRQKIDTRRVMGLALLMDVPLWQHGFHAAERERLLGLIDRAGIRRAAYRGYWRTGRSLGTTAPGALLSEYRLADRALSIVLNTTERTIKAPLLFGGHDEDQCSDATIDRRLSDGELSGSIAENSLSARLAPFDFAIVTLKGLTGCEPPYPATRMKALPTP